MKRKLSFCIVLALLWSHLWAAGALSDNLLLFSWQTFTGERGALVQDMAVCGDSLYLFTDKLWVYRPDGKEPVPVPISNLDATQTQVCLVSGGSAPILLDKETGTLGELKENDVVWGEPLPDWDKLAGYDHEIVQALLLDQKLCVRVAKNKSSMEEFELWLFDLSARSGSKLPVDRNIIGMHPYAEGRLLIVSRQTGNQNAKTSVEALNPDTGAVEDTLYETAQTLPMDAVYDAASGFVYLTISGQIVPFSIAERRLLSPVAYLSMQEVMVSAHAELLPSGRLALLSNGAAAVYAVDQAVEGRVLRIMGAQQDEVLTAYNLAHPEAPAVLVNQWVNGSGVVMTDVISGVGCDLYLVNNYSGIDALIDKGYAADISGSALLVSEAKRMYPWAQEVLMRGEKLFAFPSSLSMLLWSADMAGLEEVGFDYPATMDDFFDMMERWESGLSEQHPNYRLLREYTTKHHLAMMLLRAYVAQYEQPGERLVLNTPALRKALERLREVPLDDASSSDNADPTELIRIDGTPFRADPFRDSRDNSRDFFPAPSFEQGQAGRGSGFLHVYLLNPNSPNTDLALQYLEFAAAHLPVATRYILYPDLSDPVMDPLMQQRIEDARAEIAGLQARMEGASDAEKSDLAFEISLYESSIGRIEPIAWSVEAERLKHYREYAPQITLYPRSLIINGEMNEDGIGNALLFQLYDLLQAYLDGQLSVEEALREMDRRVEMAYLEGR